MFFFIHPAVFLTGEPVPDLLEWHIAGTGRADLRGLPSGAISEHSCRLPFRVKSVAMCNGRLRLDSRYTPLATKFARRCNMQRRADFVAELA